MSGPALKMHFPELDALEGHKFTRYYPDPAELFTADPCGHTPPHTEYAACIKSSDAHTGPQVYYNQAWVRHLRCTVCEYIHDGSDVKSYNTNPYTMGIFCPGCKAAIFLYYDIRLESMYDLEYDEQAPLSNEAHPKVPLW